MKFVDAEGAVRAWLLESGIALGHVWFSVPDSGLAFPGVLITRTGGNLRFSQDDARLQFDCFGATKAEANALAYDLAGMLEESSARTGHGIQGAYGITLRPGSRPEDPYRRVIVEAFVTIKAAR